MEIQLWDHQKEALSKLKNGSILFGKTGSGKSLTAISFYKDLDGLNIHPDLYIITTAMKRDTGDWERECSILEIKPTVVDSWNNITKYINTTGAFFIFDEQRLIGSGVWVKAFYKISKKNRWIMLSATPADSWMDLIPVFIANGFYKNRTEFIRRHVVFEPYVKYPKIKGYQNITELENNRSSIFVLMPDVRRVNVHKKNIHVEYNEKLFIKTVKTEWNPFTNRPINNYSEHMHVLRRIVNQHPSRYMYLLLLLEEVKKIIVFYNFNYELDSLKRALETKTYAEHNGFRHQEIPSTDSWVYLVQYASGSEGWECFDTNHMLFYSLNYSYRTIEQSMGRINRKNTKFTDLYYYFLVSKSPIDRAVSEAYTKKKRFNQKTLYDKIKQQYD